MAEKLSFWDRLWVLQAFLRGKVLREEFYRPMFDGLLFVDVAFATVKRMTALIDWWGFRLATPKEVGDFILMQKLKGLEYFKQLEYPYLSAVLIFDDEYRYVLYIGKNGFRRSCGNPYLPLYNDGSYRFLAIRK